MFSCVSLCDRFSALKQKNKNKINDFVHIVNIANDHFEENRPGSCTVLKCFLLFSLGRQLKGLYFVCCFGYACREILYVKRKINDSGFLRYTFILIGLRAC